ncbi:polysaccharide deacetylase family protein [Paenibacillus senegalensis]|uniref:polysaccharide deacetylase family protein n=1 Tax=Paenibacillus senegalensis TaxID=1465766 RepID=UPI001F18EB7B|nr:polysaccharide deacetylase family protein [Paenibacillus senegalensis]
MSTQTLSQDRTTKAASSKQHLARAWWTRTLPLAVFGLMLLTAACQSNAGEEGALPPSVPPQAQDQVQQPPSASPSAKENEDGADEEAAPEPQPELEPPAKAYRMNQNYVFVPLQEEEDNKVVLLTFDDGPKHPDTLEPLLDTLDKFEAKAIFFVNGTRVEQNPELLQLIHERGQIIGNHSWDHINLKNEPADVIDQQVEKVQAIVEEVTGTVPQFFRPPHGAGNDYLRQKVREEGMLYMTWSNGSLDWDASARDNPDAVVSNVLEQLHPGSNILMHELPWTAEALEPLLTQLVELGYGFIDPDTIEIELE